MTTVLSVQDILRLYVPINDKEIAVLVVTVYLGLCN